MKRILFALTLAVAVMAAGAAQANTIIDFGSVAPGGGTITAAGGLYTGSGISVTSVGISGAPMNNGAYTIPDAVLSFRYNGSPAGADNWVKIEGSFAPAGIAAGSTLLSGSFSAFTPISFVGGLSIMAGGPDTKNAGLLGYIGLAPDTPFQLFGFTIGATTDAVGTLAPSYYRAFSTDMTNTAVPEPGSMLLLGTGLFGLAGAVRRRLKK